MKTTKSNMSHNNNLQSLYTMLLLPRVPEVKGVISLALREASFQRVSFAKYNNRNNRRY